MESYVNIIHDVGAFLWFFLEEKKVTGKRSVRVLSTVNILSQAALWSQRPCSSSNKISLSRGIAFLLFTPPHLPWDFSEAVILTLINKYIWLTSFLKIGMHFSRTVSKSDLVQDRIMSTSSCGNPPNSLGIAKQLKIPLLPNIVLFCFLLSKLKQLQLFLVSTDFQVLRSAGISISCCCWRCCGQSSVVVS